MLFAAMLGSIYTVVCQVLYLHPVFRNAQMQQILLQVVNLLVAYVMVKWAYKNTGGISACFCVGTMLVFSLVAGGVLSWLQQSLGIADRGRNMILMAVGTIWFGYLFLQRWIGLMRERMHYKTCNLPVILRLCGKQIDCRGLMDSGNSLCEPITGRPVVIVEKGLLLQHGIMEPDRYFAIPYHAIGTQNGILKGVLADELEIPGQQEERRWQKVMLGIYEGKISRQDDYQVILHPKL